MNDYTAEHREYINKVYSQAATQKAGLCCPREMPNAYTAHIPREAFDHSYGCGTPVLHARIKPGDTVVDLGSGVGIDCFVAAKIVGLTGRVIGLDMTDEMLTQACQFNSAVIENLGYDVVEFRKGLLEEMPLETNSADVVVTNCVLNLTLDKPRVFREIFRVLKPGGRLVISDIVSDRDIAPADQLAKQEWAECVTGSMSLGTLLSTIDKTGFIGTHQLSEVGWQEVKGYHFSTVTFEAYKHVSDCNADVSTIAIYLGPFAKVTDDLGNEYPRFKPVTVRDDVGVYLRAGGNADSFVVIRSRAAKANTPATSKRATPCCDPGDKAMASTGACCDTSGTKDGNGCSPSGCGPSGCE